MSSILDFLNGVSDSWLNPAKKLAEQYVAGIDKRAAQMSSSKYNAPKPTQVPIPVPTNSKVPAYANIPSQVLPTQQVAQVQQPSQNTVGISGQLTKGFQEYLSNSKDQGSFSDIAGYIPQFVSAAQKYQFLGDNPWLAPAISILETSAGRNITRPNNLLNWGINYPGNNEAFSKMTPQQVLDISLQGLGEKSPYYKQFRTGKPMTDKEIMDFAKIYEPKNSAYGPMLKMMRDMFSRQK